MKKIGKRILSTFLLACMVSTLNMQALAVNNINHSWAKPALENFLNKGWLNGYGGGDYGLDDPMTRAQYAALINRVANLEQESEDISKYSDVEQDAWYKKDLSKALAAGYLTGTSENTMSPNDIVTREQAITMVVRFLKLDEDIDTNILSQFKDHEQISPYARKSIAIMVSEGLIKGSNGALSPNKSLTRAEGITILNNSEDKLTNITAAKEEIQTDLKDGVYTGTGAGYGGTIKLQVTVSKGKITDIQIISNSETSGYLNRAKQIIKSVLEKQSTENVNAISGATKTSKGLLTALNACISQAKGGKDTSTTGATGGGGGGSGKGSSDTGKDIDIKKVTNGIYTGKANGYGGELSVQVTVKDSKVTGLQVVSHTESSGYYERGADVINTILAKGTPNGVDTVSGATYTSAAIIRAVKSVLGEQAEKSPEEIYSGKMADGTWYGTGSYSLYYENKGPDVVRVIVEDGKIKAAYSEHHIEDEGYQRGHDILDHVKNFTSLKDVTELETSLNRQQGNAYNAVSGATETARGHLSALRNAIKRAVKYEQDKVEQKVAWISFKKRPKGNMLFDEKLDLSGTILKVHFADRKVEEVPFNELSKYGITTNIENNTVITKSHPQLSKYNALKLKFIQKDSLIDIPAKVVVSQKKVLKTPTHLTVNLSDGQNKQFNIEKGKFNYDLEVIGGISDIKLYDNDKELATAEYHEDYNDYEFDLSKVPYGDGFTNWEQKRYYIKIDNSKDTSAIKSFELDTNYITHTYGVDYELDLSPLNANIVTEKGSKQRFEGWSAMEKKGFTAEPSNNYKFTKDDATSDTKEIKITNGQISKTFSVNVINYEKQTPAKIEIYDSSDKVIDVQVKAQDWKSSNGFLSIYDVKFPKKYEQWENNTFTLKVYNSDNELINDDQYKISKTLNGKAMLIDFINYKEFDEYGAYVKLIFDFSDSI